MLENPIMESVHIKSTIVFCHWSIKRRTVSGGDMSGSCRKQGYGANKCRTTIDKRTVTMSRVTQVSRADGRSVLITDFSPNQSHNVACEYSWPHLTTGKNEAKQ